MHSIYSSINDVGELQLLFNSLLSLYKINFDTQKFQLFDIFARHPQQLVYRCISETKKIIDSAYDIPSKTI